VQSNGKFRCVPSVDNFKAFRKKVKHIVNNSDYGAKVKAEKLAPIVRGWRNYHRYCKMDGSRFSLSTSKTERSRYSTRKLNRIATLARNC
jgi:retron-type reverse transcriptase